MATTETSSDISTRGDPLDPDPERREARAGAVEARRAFEKARTEAVKQHGGDLNALAGDVETTRRLKELADRSDELRDRSDAFAGRTPSGTARDGTRSTGKAFLDKIGPEGKALVSGSAPVAPFFDPAIRRLPQRQLFVRSVIPVRACDGDSVWYVRQTVLTNNAAPVAAGAVKPTSVITVERVEAPVRVIAHVSEALDRSLLADAEQLTSFIDAEMRLGVLLAEEAQILSGDGSAPNLRGILNTVGLQTHTITTESIADAVFMAMTKVRLAFFEPDAIVLHPNDWETVRLSKATGGSEEYLSAPVVASDPDRLWGVPIITSPVIAEGVGLVGAFAAGATVWDREQARVTFAETGLGDTAGHEMFTRNLVRYRAEERIAFSVERPAAFCSLDLIA